MNYVLQWQLDRDICEFYCPSYKVVIIFINIKDS